MKIDYLIIGQGLAGSLLGWELMCRQKKVIIVDNDQENASLVAAGLINPVTGLRFVKSTDVDELLPTALNYYKQLGCYFRQDFYIKKPMLRILRSDKELVTAQKRLKQVEYQGYLNQITATAPRLKAKLGLLHQQQTGYLLTQPLLFALKKHFIANNAYISAEIHCSEIKLSPVVQWKNYYPKQIIFCEGYHAVQNPWFSWLPFQLVKGEIITATSKETLQDNILNYGHWFIPLNAHQFRTGATFDRENLNENITVNAQKHLLSSLKNIYLSLKVSTTIEQQAGIRPTTLDKQPFIGKHPQYPELVMFNGFGSKGSLQIPAHCQNLADHLLSHHPIRPSSNIQRFYDQAHIAH